MDKALKKEKEREEIEEYLSKIHLVLIGVHGAIVGEISRDELIEYFRALIRKLWLYDNERKLWKYYRIPESDDVLDIFIKLAKIAHYLYNTDLGNTAELKNGEPVPEIPPEYARPNGHPRDIPFSKGDKYILSSTEGIAMITHYFGVDGYIFAHMQMHD